MGEIRTYPGVLHEGVERPLTCQNPVMASLTRGLDEDQGQARANVLPTLIVALQDRAEKVAAADNG